MRKDYKYVESATDLCFTTTETGDKWLEEIVNDDGYDSSGEDVTVDVLGILQNEYVLVEKGKIATMEMFKVSLAKSLREYGGYNEERIGWCLEEAEKLWNDGHIGVKLVIWD